MMMVVLCVYKSSYLCIFMPYIFESPVYLLIYLLYVLFFPGVPLLLLVEVLNHVMIMMMLAFVQKVEDEEEGNCFPCLLFLFPCS